MTKYVFVTGGVVSSVGKGIVTASLGRILKSSGHSVSILKLDPYINVDPGTMSPYQHGEVFVTDDGAETDLDLGHYERFLDTDFLATNSTSTGPATTSTPPSAPSPKPGATANWPTPNSPANSAPAPP